MDSSYDLPKNSINDKPRLTYLLRLQILNQPGGVLTREKILLEQRFWIERGLWTLLGYIQMTRA